jgi:putative colanic acid biosynthesis acetyltransferase WcaF
MVLRQFGAQIGQHVHIHGNVKIWAPWNLCVGDFVGIGDAVNLYCMDKILIGDYAVISQGAHLCAGGHDFNRANFQLITAPILIGARAWICADAFVGMGVTIPEGVVLGARAMVGKSIVESWTVWGGVPAKKIGTRDRQQVLGSK